ncbi:putative peptidoglycan binding domain 1:N-acetylmuramoylLl-alanine amidase (plasmid) [Leptolyngbya sp. NIES-3755]|nr:putative peptidoglycan binding domain 1:N-acetylmuramoylLl-alanine amidase [Leptolyngbya sp. NIES-3755]
MIPYTLRIVQTTHLKQELLPIEQLPDAEKCVIEAETELLIRSYLQVIDHVRFTLWEKPIMGLSTWYVSVDAVQLLKQGELLTTLESPAQHGHGTSESCRRPPLIWEPSPNFSSRNGTPIRRIILHCTATNSLATVLNWFRHPNSQVSVHYVIARDGKIHQLVRDSDKAWHAYGENADSIGIEHVADIHETLSPAQETAAIVLLRWLMAEYKIPAYAVTGHRFSPSHQGDVTCPHHLFGNETEAALRTWITKHLT